MSRARTGKGRGDPQAPAPAAFANECRIFVKGFTDHLWVDLLALKLESLRQLEVAPWNRFEGNRAR